MRLSFLSFLILVVVVGAAVGGAYGAGMVAGRGSAPAPAASSIQAQGAAGAQGGLGAGGPGGAAGGAGALSGMGGRGVLGTVEKVEGNTLTIAAASGGSTQVTLNQETSIQKTTDASREELRPGVRVLIMGQQGSGGDLVASSIQIVPAEGAAPGQTQRGRPQGTPASAP